MGVRKGFEKGPPSSFCLQHSQDPSTLFPLRPFAVLRSESLCLGGLKGDFPGGGSAKVAVPGTVGPEVRRFCKESGSNPMEICIKHDQELTLPVALELHREKADQRLRFLLYINWFPTIEELSLYL